MSNIALIVAAGRGARAGGGLPKQYRPIGGRMILALTLDALLKHPEIDKAMVVIHPDDRSFYDAATVGFDPSLLLEPVLGGNTRSASVRNGLEAL